MTGPGHYSHAAGRRRARVRDRSRRRQHRNVQRKRYVLFSGLIDTLDVVRLRIVRHQLRVLLNHEDEAGQTLINNRFVQLVYG